MTHESTTAELDELFRTIRGALEARAQAGFAHARYLYGSVEQADLNRHEWETRLSTAGELVFAAWRGLYDLASQIGADRAALTDSLVETAGDVDSIREEIAGLGASELKRNHPKIARELGL